MTTGQDESSRGTDIPADHQGVQHSTQSGASRLPDVMVLTARPARRRTPSATCWRLTAYDPTTAVPVADLGGRWEPATASALPGVTTRVRAWLANTLGQPVTVGDPAEALAGPCSWYVHTARSAGETCGGT